ncbi:putative aliphatic sulfonates transport permease protein SsuC [compost metagenome]
MSNGAEIVKKRNSAVPLSYGKARVRYRSYVSEMGAGTFVPLLIIMIWQLGGTVGWISQEFLPAPFTIVKALFALLASGELIHHLGVSIGRAGLGFLAGGLLGLLLGIATGLFRKLEYMLDPSIQVLRLVPHLAIAPLIILWFGFGEASKIAIIISGSLFPMYINTFIGIRQADHKWIEVGKVLGFSSWQKFRRVIFPASLPHILLGVRLSMAVAWIGLVVAELIGSNSGVGFLINEAKQNSNTEIIFVGILIFAVVGKLIDSFMKIVERKLLSWRDSYQG